MIVTRHPVLAAMSTGVLVLGLANCSSKPAEDDSTEDSALGLHRGLCHRRYCLPRPGSGDDSDAGRSTPGTDAGGGGGEIDSSSSITPEASPTPESDAGVEPPPTSQCGAPGQSCCEDDTCAQGTVCTGGTCDSCPSCGAYYIDCASGSDSNSGTSKDAPWLHQPYMAGFSGSYQHAAGDRFFFKGGVTCPNADLPIVPQAGGTQATPDYYGADPTWFAGSAFTRPIFDSQGAPVGTNNVELDLNTADPSWVTIDNIEFTGHYWGFNYNYAQNTTVLATFDQSGIVIENCYFHGWTHAPYASGANYDSYQVISGTTWAVPANPSGIVLSCTFEDSDGDGISGAAIYNWTTMSGNIMHDMSNAIVGGSASVHDNLIYNIHNSYDPTDHENGIETWLNPGNPTVGYIYRNVIHDTDTGVFPMPINPGFGKTGATQAYVFDNVMWNNQWGPPMQVDTLCVTDIACTPEQTSVFIWNNTLVTNTTDGASDACIRIVNRGTGNQGTLDIENTQCVSESTLITYDDGISVDNLVTTDVLLETHATATSQGYVIGNSFAPTSSSSPTVGGGTSLAADCSGALAPVCQDVQDAPRAGAWDIGAYQFE